MIKDLHAEFTIVNEPCGFSQINDIFNLQVGGLVHISKDLSINFTCEFSYQISVQHERKSKGIP